MAGIYIHIPFCKQACYYCDFHFSTNLKAIEEITDSISRELEWQKDYLGREQVNSIYFGGGTPSLLNQDQLEQLFKSVAEHYDLDEEREITLEANPDDVTREKTQLWLNLGVNRLSIGIQSFMDRYLGFLNRIHDSRLAVKSFEIARESGFGNINIDLIYGIQGMNNQEWQLNLKKAFDLDPEHISAYSLTIEEKTVFGNWVKKGKLEAPDENLSAEQFEILLKKSEENGFRQYEISNFAKPGYFSLHNTGYWQSNKYLGVGPGAHSYNGKSRQFNIRNNALYLKSIKNGKIPFDKEVLSMEDQYNEYLMTNIRTEWGCDLKAIKKKYKINMQENFKDSLEQMKKNGFIEINGDRLFLTKKGKLLADEITAELFLNSYER